MSHTDDIEELALRYPCAYCRTGIGYWCRTKSGRLATMLHTGRTWPLHNAWGAGYQEDEKYFMESLRRRVDTLRERMRRHGVDEQAIEEILHDIDKRWF